jgi:hypothetical protein
MIFIPIFLELFILTSHAQENIGYVFDVSGKWIIEGNAAQPVSKTDPLPPGAVIRLAPDSAIGAHYIYIHSRFGKPLAGRECESAQNCEPIILPKSLKPESSLFARIFASIMDVWNRDTKKHEPAISRSIGRQMQEGVVQLTANGLDLRQVFAHKPRGLYLLRFESKTVQSAPELEPVKLKWNPGKPTSLNVSGLSTGIYQIELLDLVTREPVGPGDNTWVLILKPGEYYNRASADFKVIAAQVSSWGTRHKKANRSFLRAGLSYLASQMTN